MTSNLVYDSFDSIVRDAQSLRDMTRELEFRLWKYIKSEQWRNEEKVIYGCPLCNYSSDNAFTVCPQCGNEGVIATRVPRFITRRDVTREFAEKLGFIKLFDN